MHVLGLLLCGVITIRAQESGQGEARGIVHHHMWYLSGYMVMYL